MAGRTGIVKDKGRLYGDVDDGGWGLSDMEKAGGKTGIMARAAKRAAAAKKKKVSAKPKKRSKEYMTRKFADKSGKIVKTEPYKVTKGEDYAKTKASRKAVNKASRKRRGEPEVSSRTKQNLRGIQRWL